MAMKIFNTTFVPRVRGLLMDNMESAALEGIDDVGTLSLNGAIKENVEEAVVACYRMAPMDMFGESVTETNGLTMSADVGGGGVVTLPATYVRMFAVNAANWSRAVYDVEMDSPSWRYDVARDPLNGTVGTMDDPYVLVQGKRMIVFPYAVGAKVSVRAVKLPEASATGIDVDAKLYDAACYYCAYLVAMARGQGNAERYRTEALLGMGIVINNNQ